jgi:hypothetical protein
VKLLIDFKIGYGFEMQINEILKQMTQIQLFMAGFSAESNLNIVKYKLEFFSFYTKFL